MSHDETVRRLERELQRDGRLCEFVFSVLEGMNREDLGLVFDRFMELMKQRNPASEAYARGIRAHARLTSGEITPEELTEELQARPLRDWADENAQRARAARGFESFMGLEPGSVAAELIGPLEGDPE